MEGDPVSDPSNHEEDPLDSNMFSDLAPVTWLNDQDDDDCNLFFHRVESDEIIYEEKKRRCKLIGKYVMGDMLGEGSYGKVKELLDSETLTRLAVKILKKRKLRRIPHGEMNVHREMQLLHGLQHENVIRLVDTLYNEEKQKLYIVFEFCIGGLQELLDSAPGKCVPAWQAHGYMRHLCAGLAYLHSRRIVHKDIKPGNLLIALDGTLKITDLGVAEAFPLFAEDDSVSGSQGTPAFQSPEVAAGSEGFSGFKLDVWSSGVTLFNFVTGRYPFQGDNVYRLFEAIATGEFEMPAEVESELSSLIRGMLCKDAGERFTLAQVRAHPWLVGRPAVTGAEVPLPMTRQHPLHSSTVVPYLMTHHYGTEEPGSASLVSDQIHECGEKRVGGRCRWRRPITCIGVKKFPSCKAS